MPAELWRRLRPLVQIRARHLRVGVNEESCCSGEVRLKFPGPWCHLLAWKCPCREVWAIYRPTRSLLVVCLSPPPQSTLPAEFFI